ncbi:MAG TPA: PEP-CTERM sorting domain-containing protein [Alicycliphilus sp.]|nr:PEP-CTERM sorting domain-containing protein [Alicycliphilus sp.]
MKKHMLKIALAVAVVLGGGSIATGSVILARMGAPNQESANATGNANVMHQVLPEAPDRDKGGRKQTVAMVNGPDTVLTTAGSGANPQPAPLAQSAGTSPVAAVISSGSAGVVGASGIGAASAGAGGVSSALGRNGQQVAMAMPLTAMPRPSSDSSARAGGSSAGPTGTPGPAASSAGPTGTPGPAASSGGPTGTPGPAASSGGPTGTLGPAASLPEVLAIPTSDTGITPAEIAKAVLPALADVNPDTVPHSYGPSDLPAIPPSLDVNDSTGGPVITAGAKDPAASPGNTVAEPSTLALLGIVALGLAARRRRRA